MRGGEEAFAAVLSKCQRSCHPGLASPHQRPGFMSDHTCWSECPIASPRSFALGSPHGAAKTSNRRRGRGSTKTAGLPRNACGETSNGSKRLRAAAALDRGEWSANTAGSRAAAEPIGQHALKPNERVEVDDNRNKFVHPHSQLSVVLFGQMGCEDNCWPPDRPTMARLWDLARAAVRRADQSSLLHDATNPLEAPRLRVRYRAPC